MKAQGYKIIKRIIRGSSAAVAPIERVGASYMKIKNPPILITGPARTGTTLAYQTLSIRFGVGHTTKFVSYFPRSPITAALLSSILQGSSGSSSYSSHYGSGEGLFGIHQCQSVWGRWFRSESPGAQLCPDAVAQFRTTLAGLERWLGTPLVIKWPGFVAHLDSLKQALPEAYYVFTERENIALMRSIAKGRLDIAGTVSRSISESPDSRHLDYAEDGMKDIAEYLRAVRAGINVFANSCSPEQVCSLDYNALCESPSGALEIIRKGYKRWCGIEMSHVRSIPRGFRASSGPSLPVDLENELAARQDELVSIANGVSSSGYRA